MLQQARASPTYYITHLTDSFTNCLDLVQGTEHHDQAPAKEHGIAVEATGEDLNAQIAAAESDLAGTTEEPAAHSAPAEDDGLALEAPAPAHHEEAGDDASEAGAAVDAKLAADEAELDAAEHNA